MIKMVDTAVPMNEEGYPVARAKHIWLDDDTNLQKAIDDGLIGGNGTASNIQTITEEEYQNLTEQEKLEGDFHCYDTGNLYYKGVSYGRQTDISGKQDDLNKIKFTMRRNGVNEPRYCLIGKSDLNQTILMNEPYIFEGVFGSNTSSDKKSIITLSVSFKNGADKDNIFRGYADCADGFQYVDLVVTVDEENMAYAYVDFKQESSLATGSIRVPSINTEYYMDLETEFVLVDSMQGTELCRMSDYAKIITNIDDTTTSTDTVWSSKKTSGELTQKLNANNNVSMVGLGFTKGDTVHVSDFLGALVAKFGRSGYCNMLYANASSATVINSAGTQSVLINGGVLYFSAINEKFPNDTWSYAEAIYYPIEGVQGKMYKFFARTAGEAGTVGNSGIYQYSSDIEIINDTVSDSTSTYSSAKIDEKIDGTTIKTTSTTDSEYYAITFKDKQFERGSNQGILIQHNRLNFEPVTFIFSASSYNATSYERDNYDVTKINGAFYNPTSSYMMQFYMDKTNNTLYLSVPSYSGVSLTDLQFKGDAITYTKVSAIPDTATKITVTEYASIDDTSTGDTNSTWSSSKIANEIGRTQVPHVGTSTGWKATKDLSSLPIGTYRLTSMHSSSGSVIDALILKTGYSYFLKTILKEGANITVGISDDTLTVAESTTSIGVISVFLNVVGINA